MIMVRTFNDPTPRNVQRTSIFEQSQKDLSLYIMEDSVVVADDVELLEKAALFLVEKTVPWKGTPTQVCSILGLYVSNVFSSEVPKAIDLFIRDLKQKGCRYLWCDAADIRKHQLEKMPGGILLDPTEILKYFADDAQCEILDEQMIELQPNHRR